MTGPNPRIAPIGILELFQKVRQVTLRLSRGILCHIGVGKRRMVGDCGRGRYPRDGRRHIRDRRGCNLANPGGGNPIGRLGRRNGDRPASGWLDRTDSVAQLLALPSLPLSLVEQPILLCGGQRGDRLAMRETQNFPPAGNLERPAAALPQV
jgi:hypothetical protein